MSGSFQVMLGGDWCDFPPSANKKIRDAYLHGETKVAFQMKLDGRTCDYELDFSRMVQIATFSKKERQARAPWDIIQEMKNIAAAAAAAEAALAGGDVEQEYKGKGNQDIAKARQALMLQMEKTSPAALKGVDDVDFLIALRLETRKIIEQATKAPLSEEEVRPLRDRMRKVHNMVQDLRGAIRVYCRTRPFNQREKDMGAKTVLHFADDKMGLKIISDDGEEHKFSFDTTFNPGTQAEVYEELQDLIQSAYDGYCITVFAYGQTGSGKTFTMYGPKNDKGAVCRAIMDVFEVKKEVEQRAEVTVSVGMVELYCSVFTDLLLKDVTKPVQMAIRKDQEGQIYMDGQLEIPCQSGEELWGKVEAAFDGRRVAATAMNADSSRSHLILTIKIHTKNKTTGQVIKGKLTMVDLAGSERVKDSMVEGDQLKEAIEINKSLTALGDVMEQLTSGSKTVAYRNHALTHVLSDSLGGTAKTLMFANVSPASVNFGETVMTCKWATRAKNVVNDGGKAAAAAKAEAKGKAKSKPKASPRK